MRIVKLKGMRQINGLHYAPDGRRLLAVGGYEVRSVDEARWVDVIGGTETLRVPLNASCYAVSPDLSRIAVGEAQSPEDDTEFPPVVVFDPTDSEWFEDEARWQQMPVALTQGMGDSTVNGVTFEPSVKWLAVSSTFHFRVNKSSIDTHQVQMVPLDRRRKLRGVAATANSADALTFSPDGSSLTYCGGGTGTPSLVKVHAVTLKAIYRFTIPTTQVSRLACAPDGDTLAIANWKNVFLLPPDLSAPRLTLAHPKQVNAVAFTPDSRRILTTCTDKLVRVWDAATGQLVTSYDWNVGVTNAVAVAPDGLTAAVSGQTGRVVLFDLEG